MFQSLIAAFKLPDLRKRILFVFAMFGVYVIGVHIPVPGIKTELLEHLFGRVGLLDLVDTFTGGALRRYSILAMGIMPYITASIIMQLLTIAVPSLEEMAKEGGEFGRKKISQYTRYMTIALAMFQAFGMNMYMRQMGALPPEIIGTVDFIKIILVLTAGTAFLMWMGEQITDKGVGNGVSLVIFCGIMIRMPYYLAQTVKLARAGGIPLINVAGLGLIFIATITVIVLIQLGERKIPVQYAKRVVGTRMYGGHSSHLPVKVNTAGVIPIIFASCILQFPQVLQLTPLGSRFKETVASINHFLTPGISYVASGLYFALIVFFTYFYTAVVFNPREVADNLKKWGGFVPGIRPGQPTAEYLDRVLARLTLMGAIFLGVIALLQYHVPQITQINTFPLVGGTSLLIVVGVALETLQQIEAHLVMRRYEGFIR